MPFLGDPGNVDFLFFILPAAGAMDFTVQTVDFTVEMMDFTVETMNFTVETMDFTMETMDSTVETMDLGARPWKRWIPPWKRWIPAEPSFFYSWGRSVETLNSRALPRSRNSFFFYSASLSVP
jgi:hypothetical protein